MDCVGSLSLHGGIVGVVRDVWVWVRYMVLCIKHLGDYGIISTNTLPLDSCGVSNIQYEGDCKHSSLRRILVLWDNDIRIQDSFQHSLWNTLTNSRSNLSLSLRLLLTLSKHN